MRPLIAFLALALTSGLGVGPASVAWSADDPPPQPTEEKDKPSGPKVAALQADEPAPSPPPDDKDKPTEPKLS
ncbi:MAG: hypothetical protein KatS3mg082_1813 [Nitrospiraceae bacterium]|nr:MAG: hypothetical protein KatS3mg082_1813 [Nitrospiraceae bacterium]